MRNTIALIGMATFAMANAGQAATINISDAACIANCAGTTSGTTKAGVDFVNQLQVGTVYSLDNPSFKDTDGVAYDARVEVIGLSGGGNASSINVTGVNEWMHLRFSFVVDGSLSTLNPNGTAATVKGVRFVNVFDIDSNPGASGSTNFTDVVGIDAKIVGLGGALEQGGFLVAPSITAPPTVGGNGTINYARLSQEFVPGNEWENEPNYKPGIGLNEADFVASFDTGGDLTGFDLVWGSTGVPSERVVRGFEISLDSAAFQTTPIPLPATLPLLLAGLGVVGIARRRRG